MKHLKKPLVNVISSSATCFWINIYADPSNQPIRFEEQVYSLGLQPGLGSTSVLFTYPFPLI